MLRIRRSSWPLAALLGLGAALTAVPAGAQSRPPVTSTRPDFLFRRPTVSVSLRGGYAMPSASGGIFDQVRGDLTISRHAFNGAAVSGELAVRATERMDVVVDLGRSGNEVRSEFRHFTDNLDNPIEQTTRFTRTPLTFGVKGYLWNRGRSVGHFAWIPQRWTPFIGAGAGWVWYSFVQKGDFIDFQDYAVFSDRYVSEGRTSTFHVFGGADWSLGPAFFLTAEGRYAWARSPMEQDFQGFDRIDLSGFQASAGISLRF
jgi:hypothetical protein